MSTKSVGGVAVVVFMCLAAPVWADTLITWHEGSLEQSATLATDELLVVGIDPTDQAARTGLAARMPGARIEAAYEGKNSLIRLHTTAKSVSGLDAMARELRQAGYEVRACLYPEKGSRTDNTRRVPVPEVAVKLRTGVSLDQVLSVSDVTLIKNAVYDPQVFILRPNSDSLLACIDAANAIDASGLVEFASPQLGQRMEKRSTPNDPLYPDQFYLHPIGDYDMGLEEAWEMATGAGVTIAVVDDGVDATHPDLDGNVRADLGYDFVDDDANSAPEGGDWHGTAAAGVAAAEGNNNEGIVGVAYDSTIVPVRLIWDFVTDRQIADALSWRVEGPGPTVDISLNCWGPPDEGFSIQRMGPLSRMAIEYGIAKGRDGKAIIYVWPSGNGGWYEPGGYARGANMMSFDEFAANRYTLSVTARAANYANNAVAPYAESGASINTSAIAAADTGNILSTAAFGEGNVSGGLYTTSFGGTCAAAAQVSGIVALMLEQRPDLSWNDVQELIERTGEMYGDERPQVAPRAVSARKAVRLAKTWKLLGPEVVIEKTDSQVTPIPEGQTLWKKIQLPDLADEFIFDTVEVSFDFQHDAPEQLDIVFEIDGPEVNIPASETPRSFDDWAFVVNAKGRRAPLSTGRSELSIRLEDRVIGGCRSAITANSAI